MRSVTVLERNSLETKFDTKARQEISEYCKICSSTLRVDIREIKYVY